MTAADDAVENMLQHYGAKGMKWGVRKDREKLVGLGPNKVVRKMKNGDTVTLTKTTPNAFNKTANFMSPKYAPYYNRMAHFDIADTKGKKIGQGSLWKKNDEELYLNWISIDKSARGQGYATATLLATRDYGKKLGFKRMTLEVPGIAPDAKHIYSKMGFKEGKTDGNTKSDPLWGGLTTMQYDF